MRSDDSYRICFVCSGNICRSPIAEAVLRSLAERAGLTGLVVDSAGTGGWHIGERADLRAQQVLVAAGYDGSLHRARQFDRSWFAERDLTVALDAGHARTLRGWAPDQAARDRVRMLREYDPAAVAAGDLDVPDPYYDGEAMFRLVLGQIETACAGLLEDVRGSLRTAGTGGRSAPARIGSPD